MDWLILIVFVPAILVPIVLLCGFAGCGLDVVGSAAPSTLAPTNFTAKANGTDKIDLTWQDTSPTALFTVTRTIPTFKVILASSPALSVTDTGRNDGTDFTYELTANDGAGAPSAAIVATATTKPNAPTNLVATAEAVDKIGLTWDHVTNSKKTIQFRRTRTLKTPPGGSTEIPAPKPPPGTTFDDTVAEGSDNEYQITAVAVNGFDNSISTDVLSDPSAKVSAKPLAFDARGKLTTDQTNAQGFCLVQRISSALLKNSGTQIKITVRGPSAGSLTIDKIYISQVAASGDPYDSLPAPDPGLTMVATGVPLPVIPSPDPTAATLGPITYALDRTKDLIIAFDINPTPGQGNLRHGPLPGAVAYGRPAAAEAGTANRTTGVPPGSGYGPAPDTIYLVEKIEVS